MSENVRVRVLSAADGWCLMGVLKRRDSEEHGKGVRAQQAATPDQQEETKRAGKPKVHETTELEGDVREGDDGVGPRRALDQPGKDPTEEMEATSNINAGVGCGADDNCNSEIQCFVGSDHLQTGKKGSITEIQGASKILNFGGEQSMIGEGGVFKLQNKGFSLQENNQSEEDSSWFGPNKTLWS
ncbi:hypothetical protein L1049_006359 [Liquidambar formosana]|uniref:Uncharacterized protein n=1 Tax=Liquidambar formosana TaxID=63359 RepID=A0AAP0RFE4_LIQFO